MHKNHNIIEVLGYKPTPPQSRLSWARCPRCQVRFSKPTGYEARSCIPCLRRLHHLDEETELTSLEEAHKSTRKALIQAEKIARENGHKGISSKLMELIMMLDRAHHALEDDKTNQ